MAKPYTRSKESEVDPAFGLSQVESVRLRVGIPSSGLGITERQRESAKLGVLATVVGLLAAILAVLFRRLIEGMTYYGFEGMGDALSSLGPARYALIPVIGGLIVGPIIWWYAKECKGSGIPEVMDSVTRFGGKIRARVIGVKAVTASITIGTGGSAGREGPIVHMSSAIGSNLAQSLKMTPAHTKILLGCGAAAGITATFNTPIAGVLFAIELILMEFKTRSFIPLVIASVIATVFAPGFDASLEYLSTGEWPEEIWKAHPAFDVPERFRDFELSSPWELLAFLALGIICGLAALLFIKSLYWFEDIFDRLRLKPWLKPALGGLLLGGVGIAFVQVHGVGYEFIEEVIDNEGTLTFMAVVTLGVLVVVKILGVSLTLGSGGSGGIFAPVLFIGCMLGACFGGAVDNFTEINVGAYALVGMAALVAASTRGTLTAILMIFEMTRVYEIILPLLFACVISDLVASMGSPDTIYTKKLSRRGVQIVQDLEPNIMQLFSVKDVMVPREKVITVSPEDQLHKVMAIIRRTGHNGFPVLDDDDRLVGVVTHEDVRNAHNEGNLFIRTDELMTPDMVSVTPYDTGETALRRMGDMRISHLPVVDPYDATRLMGWISKGDLVFAYEAYHRRMEAPFGEEVEAYPAREPEEPVEAVEVAPLALRDVPEPVEEVAEPVEKAPLVVREPPKPLLKRIFRRRERVVAQVIPSEEEMREIMEELEAESSTVDGDEERPGGR